MLITKGTAWISFSTNVLEVQMIEQAQKHVPSSRHWSNNSPARCMSYTVKQSAPKQNVMWGRQYSHRGHARTAVDAEASAQQQTHRISG